ncbi:MAG: hypothetical protein GY714_04300 [Desulfobacterales bacterium]|nr:hypothetical protein [Desulfobacterales bacterium]
MNKICLIGGSNSVMKTGLSLGVCDKGDHLLALGASSSIQNIHSICSCSKQIDESDYIITESNVNVAYNIYHVGYDKSLILENIKSLYDELYRTGKNIISIILPMKHYSNTVAPSTVVNEVNSLHRELSIKYGFYLIDLAQHFSNLDASLFSTKFIQPDSLHLLESFMYTLGCNIKKFVLEQASSDDLIRRYTSNFIVVSLSVNCNKGNSKFVRSLHELKETTKVSIDGAKLVGIETWSDGLSELLIETDGTKVIKQFSSNLSFNEIQSTNPMALNLSSNVGESLNISEPSVNVENKSIVKNRVKISSLLFIKNESQIINVLPNHQNPSARIPSRSLNIPTGNKPKTLDFLIPKVEAFSNGIARFLDKNVPSITKRKTADYLRDAAVKLEHIDIKLSFHLMNIAHEIRPKGLFIKKKKEEYKGKLIANKKI